MFLLNNLSSKQIKLKFEEAVGYQGLWEYF